MAAVAVRDTTGVEGEGRASKAQGHEGRDGKDKSKFNCFHFILQID
jgi:hypothetical protein